MSFLMLFTPRSVTVLMVSGTELMEFTVKSETVEMVWGTTLTPVTAVSGQNRVKQNSFMVTGE